MNTWQLAGRMEKDGVRTMWDGEGTVSVSLQTPDYFVVSNVILDAAIAMYASRYGLEILSREEMERAINFIAYRQYLDKIDPEMTGD